METGMGAVDVDDRFQRWVIVDVDDDDDGDDDDDDDGYVAFWLHSSIPSTHLSRSELPHTSHLNSSHHRRLTTRHSPPNKLHTCIRTPTYIQHKHKQR